MYINEIPSKPEEALISTLARMVAEAHLSGQECPLQGQALQMAYSEHREKNKKRPSLAA